jgi:hypothetical protein
MTNAPDRPSSCAHCVYWQKLRDNEGLCRRHAPDAAIRSEQVAHWPQTHAGQWCAEGSIAARPRAVCAACEFWRHVEGGLNPTDRGDMPMAWWTRAGLCVRHAPRPSSEPGTRGFWQATVDADSCGDGLVREARAATARPS